MKIRILALLLLPLLFFNAVNAQSGRITWQQFNGGVQGQIAIVGTDGKGAWVTPLYTQWSDTLTRIATKQDIANLNNKESISGAFNAGTITITKRDASSFNFGLGSYYITEAQKAAINGVATLGADGKVPSNQLPVIPGRNTYVVTSQAAQVALTAIVGDFAIRTDVFKTYVLQTAPASVFANWIELPQVTGIASVNNQTGPNVTLTTDNISEGATNKYFSIALARQALSATGAIGYNQSTGFITHNASGVSAGTYNNITVDANGHVTFGSNVAYLTSSSLGNYYTKTELQTSGQAAVHWGNITGKPTNLGATEFKQQFPSGTSAIFTLSHIPLFPDAVEFFQNGVLLPEEDYAVNGTTVTIGFTRVSTDKFTAKYSY